jgi:hypothetical protein
MGKINVTINDKLENEFRKKAFEQNMKRGGSTQAL